MTARQHSKSTALSTTKAARAFYQLLSKVFNADANQLTAIMQVKRAAAAQQTARSVGGSGLRLSGVQMQAGLMFALGIPAGVGLFFHAIFTAMTLSFTVIMTALAINFIHFFSADLLNGKDNHILLPKPISSRTLFLARILHALKTLLTMALSCGLPVMMVVGYYDGLYPVLLIALSLVLMTFLLTFFAYLFCYASYKVARPDQVQNAVLFSLVLFMAVLMLSLSGFSNVLNDGANVAAFRELTLTSPWLYGYPPAWFAGVVDAGMQFVNQQFVSESATPTNSFSNGLTGSLAMLGVALPLLALFASFYLFSRYFDKMLLAFSQQQSQQQSKPQKNTSWLQRVGIILRRPFAVFASKSSQSNAVFHFVTQLMKTDPDFKARTYPTFGMQIAVIITFVFLTPGNALKNAPVTGDIGYYAFIYIGTCFMASTLANLQFGSQHQAVWLYHALPINSAGAMLSGALKAFILRFILPLNLIVTALCAWKWGAPGIADALFGSSVSLLMCLLQCYTMRRSLAYPFSQDYSDQTSKSNLSLRTVAMVPFLLILGGIHMLLNTVFGITATVAGTLLLLFLAQRSYRHMAAWSWDSPHMFQAK